MNYKPKLAQICHARMVQTVLIRLMVMNANVLTDSQVIKTLFIFKKCQNCHFLLAFNSRFLSQMSSNIIFSVKLQV